MKHIKTLLIFVVAACTLLCFSPAALASPRDGYEITSYDVKTVISKNNVYDVTETIHVNFVEEKHGIYRTIPVNTEMTRTSGGKTYTNKVASWITDIAVEGYDYSVSSDYDNVTIKIGSANFTVTGGQTYRIRYKLHFGSDGVPGFDEVYYNIIGDKWTSMTDKLTFSVTLPETFDAKQLGFSIGYGGSTGYKPEEISFRTDGCTIQGEMLRPLYAYEAVTMRLELPDGYFDVPDIRMPDWILMGISGGLVLLCLVLFLLFGIDKRPVQTVEFYAPEDMTPAEVGYIIDGSADSGDIVSLLIYWADKGYLRIEKDVVGYRLTKLKKPGLEAKDFERYMFDRLFVFGSQINTEMLSLTFYKTMQTTERMIQDSFKPEGRRVFTRMSMKLKPWFSFISVLPVIVSLIVMLSRIELGLGFAIPMGLMFGFILLLPLYWLISLLRHWHGKAPGRRRVSLIVSLTLFVAMMVLFALITGALAYAPELPWVASLATLILGMFAVLIIKRTPKGTEWLGKIQGLRNFIELAEKDRIIALVEQNPQYFYHVLPYAYVLGVTDKWIRNFESIAIPPPDWYSGYGPVFTPNVFVTSLTGAMANIQTSMTTSPSSSGSGGSSGGSGFSGGGSSGGGGGGGGGGSW